MFWRKLFPEKLQLWHTPQQAFYALSPPDWMKHDLSVAEVRGDFSGIRTLVLQAPQLQNSRVWDYVETYVGKTEARLRQEKIHEAGLNAVIFDDAPDLDVAIDQTTQLPLTTAIVRQRPTQAALVIENPADFHRKFLVTMNTPELSLPPANPSFTRTVLGHELGHIASSGRRFGFFLGRDEEGLCDFYAGLHGQQCGNGAAPALMRDFRLLTNLKSNISPEPVGKILQAAPVSYWNSLAQLGGSAALKDEAEAWLEVKHRAVYRNFNPTTTPYGMFFGDDGERLRQAYHPYNALPLAGLLRNLQAAHRRQQPYHHPQSQVLVEGILRAAQHLTPSLLSA